MNNTGILKGTAIISILTFLSRILGFVRDLLFARLFGAGSIADAFFVAFRIPNLLRSVMAEGALTSGFVPVFSAELKKGDNSAQNAISQVSGFLIFTTVIIAALGIIFSDKIIILFAPGFSSNIEKLTLSSELLRIMFPYLIFVSIVALLGGALNSVKIFGTAAMAQVVMNIVFILGILAGMFWLPQAPYLVAWFVVFGGIAQLVYQIPALKRAGFSLKPDFRFWTPTVKSIVKLMFPAIFGAAIYQLTIFFNTVFASFLEEGSVAWLFYADRISQLPIGIFSIALASVLLPALSHAETDNDQKLFSDNLYNSLRYSTFLMVPIAVCLFVLAVPIVNVLFKRGEFTSYSALKTAEALMAYSLGLWAISCHTMLVRAYIAKKDTITPTCVGILMLLINIVSSLILIGPIIPHPQSSISNLIIKFQTHPWVANLSQVEGLGHSGLALASFISSMFGFIILCTLLSKKSITLPWSNLIHVWIKTTLSSIVAGLSVVFFTTSYFDSSLLDLLLGTCLGLFIFIVMAKILKISELEETFKIIKRLYKRGLKKG